MSLGTFIAGRYTAVKNSVSLGMTQEGFTNTLTPSQELINASDAYGDSIVDWVYRGGNMFIDYIAKEYIAENIAAIWPYGARGVLSDTSTPIARLASAIADALVLSAVANTPAAATPATHTANLTIVAPNFDVRTLFDAKLRQLPIRLQYLPYLISGSKVGWFTET